jgi:hypothetical protein
MIRLLFSDMDVMDSNYDRSISSFIKKCYMHLPFSDLTLIEGLFVFVIVPNGTLRTKVDNVSCLRYGVFRVDSHVKMNRLLLGTEPSF